MAETGMANKFYSYEASYLKQFDFSTNTRSNLTNNDSGVFVVTSNKSTMGFGPLNYRVSASDGFVASMDNNIGSYSGINMCTKNNGKEYWTFGVSLSREKLYLALWRGINTINCASTNITIRPESYIPYTTVQKLSVSVYKTEVAYQNSPLEYVYTTGLSLIAFAEDGSISGYSTTILARAVPTDGTGYPTLGSVSGITGTYCTDASVVFSDTGKVLGILESEDSAAVTSANISTSFPEEALSANDGIMAVSCMAAVDGKARWMGYKNGIYKLYHGTKPLYGMPGESVTIKEHEFRCLAYSPFYARMS